MAEVAERRLDRPVAARRRFYGWKLVALLFFAMAINTSLPIFGLAILNVHMGDELKFSRATLGTAFAAYMLMTGLPGPLTAKLIDKVGIRWTLAIGNFILMAGAVAMATAVTSPVSLVAVAAVAIGGASAIGGPIPIQALVTRWFARRRALAMGITLAGSSTTGVLFPPLLEQLVGMHGWRAGWWVIAACAALLIVAVIAIVRERPEDIGQVQDGGLGTARQYASPDRRAVARVYQTDEDWHFSDVRRSASFWMLLACSIGVSAVYTIFNAQALLQMRDLGYSTRTAAYLLSLSVSAGFVAHMLISVLGDRIDPKRIWALCLFLQGIGIGLFAQAAQPALLYAAILALGLGNGGAILCLIMVFGNWYGERAAPFVFGFGSAFSAACGALAPIASGFCYDRTGSFAPVFVATAAICVVGAAVLWIARPPRLARAG